MVHRPAWASVSWGHLMHRHFDIWWSSGGDHDNCDTFSPHYPPENVTFHFQYKGISSNYPMKCQLFNEQSSGVIDQSQPCIITSVQGTRESTQMTDHLTCIALNGIFLRSLVSSELAYRVCHLCVEITPAEVGLSDFWKPNEKD